MAIISGLTLKRLVEDGDVSISPFSDQNLQPASYDCTLGDVLEAGTGRINLKRGEEFILQSNTWASISSKEVLKLSNAFAASYGIPSSLARRGLIAFGGPQIDPGYRGKIFVSVYNPTLEPIALKQGQDFFTLIVHELDSKLEHGYSGAYQDQTDFHVADVEMMMRMRSKNLSDVIDRVETLDESVTNLADDMKMLNTSVASIQTDVHELKAGLRDVKQTFDSWKPWLMGLFAVIAAAGLTVVANFAWTLITTFVNINIF